MMCRHYRLFGLREEDVLLDDTHVGRLPQFPPAPLSQLPNSLGHLPTENFEKKAKVRIARPMVQKLLATLPVA
jgi:hypothetical protein